MQENTQDLIDPNSQLDTQENFNQEPTQDNIPDGSQEATQEQLDYLSMSDEEFEKLEQQGFTPEPDQTTPEQETDNQQAETEQPEYTNSTGSEPETMSAEDFVKQITSPFTANGRQIQVHKAEDVIRLMQMGANYNKKMEVIKPNLGMIKSLQAAGINTPEKLQLLLDINNGDKTAIAKLLQDKQIDGYDLPDLEETPYIPQAKIHTPEQAEFDDVLADVRQLPEGQSLLQSLGSKTWDDKSLEFIQTTPQALYALYQDKANGLYDLVIGTIEADMMAGLIPDEWRQKPFVELYEFVATQLTSQQQAQSIGSTQAVTKQVQQPQPQIVGHNVQPNAVIHSKQNTAPKSAGITNAGSTQPNYTDVPDFMSMTDEQFEAWEKANAGLRFN